jgi:putative FmdB family regulatory protein
MPFYEYQCRACGQLTEVLQKISDPPLKKCPSCGKSQLSKLISAPVFRLKGGGWYETDFKGDSENKRNLVGADKDEAAAKPAADAKADTKVEAKAEPKAEAKAEPKVAAKSASKTKAKPTGKPAAKPARAAAKSSAKRSGGKARR